MKRKASNAAEEEVVTKKLTVAEQKAKVYN